MSNHDDYQEAGGFQTSCVPEATSLLYFPKPQYIVIHSATTARKIDKYDKITCVGLN